MCALESNVDAVISMDADLQDDPNAVDEMILAYRQGLKSYMVYAITVIRILRLREELRTLFTQ